MAEEHEFTFAAISDHFHPWIDAQGQSPFVWSVIGAVVAQAAATAAAMMPGRFFLGVGTGENLNEHIVGQGCPGSRAPLPGRPSRSGVAQPRYFSSLRHAPSEESQSFGQAGPLDMLVSRTAPRAREEVTSIGQAEGAAEAVAARGWSGQTWTAPADLTEEVTERGRSGNSLPGAPTLHRIVKPFSTNTPATTRTAPTSRRQLSRSSPLGKT